MASTSPLTVLRERRSAAHAIRLAAWEAVEMRTPACQPFAAPVWPPPPPRTPAQAAAEEETKKKTARRLQPTRLPAQWGRAGAAAAPPPAKARRPLAPVVAAHPAPPVTRPRGTWRAQSAALRAALAGARTPPPPPAAAAAPAREQAVARHQAAAGPAWGRPPTRPRPDTKGVGVRT